jgi:hypothetical protein
MSDLVAQFARAGINHQQLADFLARHGHGGALQTVTKTVHRDGKTFEQTFHVAKKQEPKPEEKSAATKPESKPAAAKKEQKAAKAPKKVNVDDAIKAAGADPTSTKRYIDKWVEHSGNAASLSLRAAWAKQSGVKMDESRLAKIHAHATGKQEHEVRDSVKTAVSHADAVDASARAITRVSQQAYAGQTHVEVFRGVSGAQAKAIKEAIARGDKTIKISVDNASSFTDDHRIATQFAKGTGGSYKGTDTSHGGAVLKLKAPVSSILASHKAFPQQFDKKEKEVVIASHGVIEIDVSDIELH